MKAYDYFLFALLRTVFITGVTFIAAITLMLNVVFLIEDKNYFLAALLTFGGIPLTAVILFYIWELINGEE